MCGFESHPPHLCDVSGHPGHMCRDIVDTLDPRHRLVDAGGIERKLADQLGHTGRSRGSSGRRSGASRHGPCGPCRCRFCRGGCRSAASPSPSGRPCPGARESGWRAPERSVVPSRGRCRPVVACGHPGLGAGGCRCSSARTRPAAPAAHLSGSLAMCALCTSHVSRARAAGSGRARVSAVGHVLAPSAGHVR